MATLKQRAGLHRFIFLWTLIGLVLTGVDWSSAPQPTRSVIIQGASDATVAQLVRTAGGTIVGELTSIRGFVATVPDDQISTLTAAGLRVTPNQTVEQAAEPSSSHAALAAASRPPESPLYPSIVTGADQLHTRGITGTGVAVAIIDSGMPAINHSWTQLTTNTLAYTNGNRNIIYKDLVTAVPITNSSDPNGHGTHVMASIADGRTITGGNRLGVAPGVDIVVVRALDAQGQAPYSRVIAGIEWVIANKDLYNIRVLNLSLQAPVHGPYWHDPLAQATMAAWEAGITVVVASGNYGPDPATITVPGNVPYVITVGAIKPGAYTSNGVDQLAVYSSAGPTESKFVKPDVVIAGSRVIAPMPVGSTLEPLAGLVKEKAKLKLGSAMSQDQLNYYALSGTSMAAAEVSGVIALLIEDEPALSNNQIKYRLVNTAEVALDATNNPAYSIWQQGAGRVQPVALVDGTTTNSANAGLNITLDRDYLNGTHYFGTTEYDEATESFYFSGQPIGVGTYNTWAGTYNTWAGTYNTWAGSTSVWNSSYPSWTGSLANDDQTIFIPLLRR